MILPEATFVRILRTSLPQAFEDILTGYSQGDRLGVAFTRESPDNELVASLDAGVAEFIAVAEALPYSELVGSYDAGAATFGSVATAQPYSELVSSYDAEPATFDSVAEAVPDTGPMQQTMNPGVPAFMNAAQVIWTSFDDNLNPAFIEGGAEDVTIASIIMYRVGQISVNLAGSTHSFTSVLEEYGAAFTFQVPGVDDLVVVGPNHPDAALSDVTDPYNWNPPNATEIAAFFRCSHCIQCSHFNYF